MTYYTIPNTSLNVSSMIMGCMRIAALTPKEVETLVRTAIDHGVNYFDHADIYGNGNCETLFGEALDLKGSLREKLLIQGKCGIRRSRSGHNYCSVSMKNS